MSDKSYILSEVRNFISSWRSNEFISKWGCWVGYIVLAEERETDPQQIKENRREYINIQGK